MGLFKVGPKVSDVEVYVHNRYEHFKRTTDRMEVQGKIKSTVGKIKRDISQKVMSIQGAVVLQEMKYLHIVGTKTKDEYYKQFANYKNVSDDSILNAMYSFTDLSPATIADLEKIILRRFGVQTTLTTKKDKEDAFAMLYQEMQKENQVFYKDANDFFNSLVSEYNINNKKAADQTALPALLKRQEALKSSAKNLQIKKPPKTIKGAQTQAAQLRKTDTGFGVSFEPVAAGVVKSLNSFINGALKQGRIEVVADTNYDRNYTTDATFTVMDMNVGVDVKSNKALYKKSTQRQGITKKQGDIETKTSGYGYEILSSVFLGQGGFSELGRTSSKGTVIKKFGNILSNPDPEFLKKMTYLLVNSTVFQAEGVKIKAVNEAQQGLRTILIIGGLIDFIVTYIANATKGDRQQLLLFVGDEIIFTTDFINHMVKMIESINPNRLKTIYGINYKILDEGATNKVPEGLKKKMLKEKLRLVRNGVNTYKDLFTELGAKEMQQITSAALQRSMQINLNIPLSKLFKNRNS